MPREFSDSSDDERDRRKRKRSKSRDRRRRKRRRSRSKSNDRRRRRRRKKTKKSPEKNAEKKKSPAKTEEKSKSAEKESTEKPATQSPVKVEVKKEKEETKPDTSAAATTTESTGEDWKVVKKEKVKKEDEKTGEKTEDKKDDKKDKKGKSDDKKRSRRKKRSRSRSRGRRRRRRSKSRGRRRRRSRSKKKSPPREKTEWEKLEEESRKKKRSRSPSPRLPTKREKKQTKEQLDKIKRLMEWKAKQQAVEQRSAADELTRKRAQLQEEATILNQKRRAAQEAAFLDSEAKWANKKADLERRMELKLHKRREDRKRKAEESSRGFMIRRGKKKTMTFGFGKKSEEPEEKTEAPVNPLESAPRPPPKKVEEKMETDAEEIDPLDAFMNNLSEVQAADDRKKNLKKNSEVIYNDETVYDEKDLVQEAPVVPIKNWALKKKELKYVDHANFEYEHFKKNLYIEAPEIAAMDWEEIKKYQKDIMKGVKIHGKGCPKPFMKWTHIGLPEKVMKTLVKEGYERPFPIQQQTIPAIMSGRDVIGCAKTGSGKTAAFVLPMIRHIRAQRPLEHGEGPIALIIAPTRELSVQIFRETKKFCEPAGLRVAAIYGGAPISEQIAALKRGAEIVVCTPGRMIDILCTNQGRVTNAHRVTYIVLDEADRMFDLGFEPQIMSILKQCRPDKQTLLFSATFPRTIEALARQILNTPLEIIVGGRSIASEDVNQFVEIIPQDDKFKRVVEILTDWYGRGNVLIFHDQQESVDNLFSKLQQVGYMALVIHGGVDQTDRENAISDFKQKIKTVMIATSVMSRGLDVKDLKVVINYSAPHHYEDYVHRIGRTGRAGQKGWAYTFMDPETEMKFAPDILKAMIRAKQDKGIPDELRKIAEEFREKVRNGEEKFYESRGYTTKGFKFDEEEAKHKDKQKMRQQGVYANPDEITDRVLSELQKSKLKSEWAKEKLEEIDQKKSENNPINMQVSALKQAIINAKKKGKKGKDIQKALRNASKKGRVRQKKLLKQTARALADKIYHQEQIRKFENDGDMFTARIDLNDYPEMVRRRMCSRNTLDQTKSFCGDRCEILRRGLHVAPGKRPEPGYDPLHLLVQSDSKMVVSMAQRELCRVLNEAVQNLQKQQFTGRYTVI